jgi:RNA polymerase sigma factor (sigma-70 family)
MTAADRLGPEQVYADHGLALVRLAFLLTGSREQAEDAVQQAFASAIERWSTIEHPAAYVKRAVVNLAADSHRRRRRDRTVTERAGVLAEVVTTQPELDEMWVHIRALPDRQRAVVVLRYYEDLPLHRIAELLSRPAATVRSDLRRALHRLRKAL